MTLAEISCSIQSLWLKSRWMTWLKSHSMTLTEILFNDFVQNPVESLWPKSCSMSLAEIPFNHFGRNPVQWLWPKSRSITLIEILFNDFGWDSTSQPRVQWVFLILIRVFNEFAWPWASHSMSFPDIFKTLLRSSQKYCILNNYCCKFSKMT